MRVIRIVMRGVAKGYEAWYDGGVRRGHAESIRACQGQRLVVR